MSLRDQPYIPLFVQDFSTDENLIECSASSTGVYIRIMCLMHKTKNYGTIELKQKDKKTDNIYENFAIKLSKHMPYPVSEIRKAIEELVDNEVLILEKNLLMQKRMIKDNIISIKRSLAGSKGGLTTGKIFASAKSTANPETEIEDEHEDEIPIKEIISYLNEQTGKNFSPSTRATKEHIRARWREKARLEDFKKVIDIKTKQWINNDKMCVFLRPETLFGTKFEGYLNEEVETKSEFEK
jgi:uncharacterized phage protein (TIGR02220 family)